MANTTEAIALSSAERAIRDHTARAIRIAAKTWQTTKGTPVDPANPQRIGPAQPALNILVEAIYKPLHNTSDEEITGQLGAAIEIALHAWKEAPTREQALQITIATLAALIFTNELHNKGAKKK